MNTGIDTLNAEIAMDDQDYYTLVGWHFSVAENLYLIDPALVPAAWQYRPSPMGVSLESYGDKIIREYVLDGEVTAQDLIEVGNMLASDIESARPEGE
jgi:hypothetical protein